MRRVPVQALDPRPLLEESPADFGAVPAALDLVRLPYVLATRKRRSVSDEAEAAAAAFDDEDLRSLPVLAPEYYEILYEYVDAWGAKHLIRIEGHNRLGLPYGYDGEVMLALFRLHDEDRQRLLGGGRTRVRDGEYVGVTVREISRAMGVTDPSGPQAERIRGALRRLSFLRITSVTTQFALLDGIARELTSGASSDARPVTPSRRRATRAAGGTATRTVREEQVTWLLEYKWRTETRSDGGEMSNWITHLRVNPLWLNQSVAGWVAWIDPERYRALGGPLARRLYELCACEAAFGAPDPWAFDVESLRKACAMSPNRVKAEAQRSLENAAHELVEAGVLSTVTRRAVRWGQNELVFTPGEVLLRARALRGLGSADHWQHRRLEEYLVRFGVDEGVARQMIETSAGDAREAVLYALFLRDTDPGRVSLSWSAMIADRFKHHRRNAGTVGYDEWLSQRMTQGASAEPTRNRAAVGDEYATVAEHEVMLPPMAPCPAVPRSAEVIDLWSRVRAAIPVVDGPMDRSYIDFMVPFKVDGAVLTCVTDLALYPPVLERVARIVEEGLRVCTDGEVTTLQVETFSATEHGVRVES